ncbi:cytidylyltransferase domain-containing protein [Cohaesibacter intestini]|uniref:acylneuraminate cytidylyltransferase family protein n=1 Tax=Cohaesibacter intestini TaxID=2211145 RepID=UPI000DE9100A|nr:acylneuraminate cytidylyltransferase family protein [Cohaesibacter intestini]
MSEIIALIPARGGSKGVPNKNIRPLAGHSLLEWSIAACLKSKRIDRTIVTTDSEEYRQLALSLGAEAPFLRPAEISQDRSQDIEFVLHALDWLKEHDSEPRLIVQIRPTTPMRDPALIDAAIAAFEASSTATSLRSVHEMSESAYKTFEINQDGILACVGTGSTALDAANRARQACPTTYFPNGYVDVLSTDFIRRTGLMNGDHVLPFLTPVSLEVDSEDDFRHIEYRVSQEPEILDLLFDEAP